MAEFTFAGYSAFYLYKKQYYVALDRLDLTIPDGKITVVVGPSGCGKTTLLKCLAGLHQLTEGTLCADGEDLERLPPGERNISYVAQEYSLYPQMTVFDNIAYPLRLMRAPHPEIDRRVRETAAELGLDWLLTRKPKQLSGGQQQRVAIARALVKKPRALLLDEPFSNLEQGLRHKLRDLVKDIHARGRQTVVFVTHDLPEAFALADHLVVLDQGCVEEHGPADEILRHPRSELIKGFLGHDSPGMR